MVSQATLSIDLNFLLLPHFFPGYIILSLSLFLSDLSGSQMIEAKDVNSWPYKNQRSNEKGSGSLEQNTQDTCMNTYLHTMKSVMWANFLNVVSKVATALITLLLEHIL